MVSVDAASIWDEGVSAAFAGMVTRQNVEDIKSSNPYRWLNDDEQFCPSCFAGTESSEHQMKCGDES